MSVSGHKTRAVFGRNNIISKEDLEEAALKRQKHGEMQTPQQRFSYGLPGKCAKERGHVSHLRVIAP